MTDYDIFREQLAIKYPNYGHALWEPDSGHLYDCVRVGDVGFVREGRFNRIFNALLPAHHEFQGNFGVPESHEPLIPFPLNHIVNSALSPNYFSSIGVTMDDATNYSYQASGPEELPLVSFHCQRRQGGAVLSIPVPANRQDTLLRAAFGEYIISHIDAWFRFTQRLRLGIERMEDIVFVTGRDCVRSYMNVVFFGGKKSRNARVSFASQANGSRVHWSVSPQNVHGAVFKQGPEGQGLPENQCIFVRGFRAVRILGIWPRLKAAAEFSSDPDRDAKDGNTEPISTKSRDPLHLLLDYVAERAIDCDMALVHDDDLAKIDGIFDGTSSESLRPNILMGHLRGSKPNIYQVEYEGLSSTKPRSATVGGIVRVATLSMLHNQDHTSQSPLTSLALQTSDMTEACYKRGRQNFHHYVTSILPSPCSMSYSVNQRHSTARPSTTPGWQSRDDVHAGLSQGSTVARRTQDLSMIMIEDEYVPSMGRYLPISIPFNKGINYLQLNGLFVDGLRALALLETHNTARPYPLTQTAHPIVYSQSTDRNCSHRPHYETGCVYQCPWVGCTSGFGTLNGLHTHMIMRGHRNKRTSAEIKELGKQCLEVKNMPGRLEWLELAEERCSMPSASAMDHQSDVSFATRSPSGLVTTFPTVAT